MTVVLLIFTVPFLITIVRSWSVKDSEVSRSSAARLICSRDSICSLRTKSHFTIHGHRESPRNPTLDLLMFCCFLGAAGWGIRSDCLIILGSVKQIQLVFMILHNFSAGNFGVPTVGIFTLKYKRATAPVADPRSWGWMILSGSRPAAGRA